MTMVGCTVSTLNGVLVVPVEVTLPLAVGDVVLMMVAPVVHACPTNPVPPFVLNVVMPPPGLEIILPGDTANVPDDVIGGTFAATSVCDCDSAPPTAPNV